MRGWKLTMGIAVVFAVSAVWGLIVGDLGTLIAGLGLAVAWFGWAMEERKNEILLADIRDVLRIGDELAEAVRAQLGGPAE